MDFKYNLEETLTARFEGEWDEMQDIVNHGISGGFSGFFYTYEINEFFNEFENEIEDYYYEIFGNEWIKDSGAADCDGFNSMRAHLVWGLVEQYCNRRVDEMAEEMMAV
jgi:hypothetical protein